MGRISDEDVRRVRDATDLVSLVSERVVLKQKGRLHWGCCPFHAEKTASFKVDPATQLWHCFGCGLGGDAYGFLMRAENVDFLDAVRILADRGQHRDRRRGRRRSRAVTVSGSSPPTRPPGSTTTRYSPSRRMRAPERRAST